MVAAWANEIERALNPDAPIRIDAVAPDWRKRVSFITQEVFNESDLRKASGKTARAVEGYGNGIIERVARVNTTMQVTTRLRAQQWQDRNIRLIRSMADRQVERIAPIVSEGVYQGLSYRDIAKQIRTTVEESTAWQAERIARDQTLKYNAELRETRQTGLGVKQFEWSTSKDSRVRDEHAELDGEIFDWDDPPDIEGEPTKPGEAILCRCIADAVIPAELYALLDEAT